MPPEPEDGPDVLTLEVRMPTNQKYRHRFLPTDPVRAVLDFVEGQHECPEQYEATLNFPTRTLHDKDPNVTLREAGIHTRELVYITSKVDSSEILHVLNFLVMIKSYICNIAVQIKTTLLCQNTPTV